MIVYVFVLIICFSPIPEAFTQWKDTIKGNFKISFEILCVVHVLFDDYCNCKFNI